MLTAGETGKGNALYRLCALHFGDRDYVIELRIRKVNRSTSDRIKVEGGHGIPDIMYLAEPMLVLYNYRPSLSFVLSVGNLSATIYPTLKPSANPARNEALCWKLAVKKSTNQLYSEYRVGGLRAPPGSVGAE